jgi:GTP-binding protein HflX
LPTTLVAAFRATLEETIHADLVLHVVDASHPDRDLQIEAVGQVLHEIDAGDVPQWLVMNKVDRLDQPPRIEQDDCGSIRRVWLSAATGSGVAGLREALASFDAEPSWPRPLSQQQQFRSQDTDVAERSAVGAP